MYLIRFGGQPHAFPPSSLYSSSSFLFSGILVTLPPSSMKEFNFQYTGVKIDVAAIEWPANATALVREDGALVCRTTDPDESKEGAETSEIRIKCDSGQVIGTLGLRRWRNDIIRRHICGRMNSFCAQPQHVLRSSFSFLLFYSSLYMLFLAGDLTQWHLPVGMKDLNLRYTKVTGKATSE
jgi:hypothetical protein